MATADQEAPPSVLINTFPSLAVGGIVENPIALKNINMIQSSLTAFMAVVAFGLVMFGYINEEQAQKIVMLVSALWVTGSSLFSAISTVMSSKKVGL